MCGKDRLLTVIFTILVTVPGFHGAFEPEIYPAPTGPDFGAIPDDGEYYLVSRSRVYLYLPDGRRKKVRLTKLLGIMAQESTFIQKQMKSGAFDDEEVKRWIFQGIDERELLRGSRRIDVLWTERRVHKVSGTRGTWNVVASARVER